MNENYEQEIDLKWLLYRVLRSWRGICLWAIIIGLVIGIGSIGIHFIKCLDPEYLPEQKRNFEREHASWVATGENLLAELSNLEDTRANQMEYNEKSVLMQINPLREYNASFEVYVYYDYQIDPNLTYQNIDLSDRILKAYATYMTNGEMYQYIINNLSYDLELRYLKEIIGVSIDYNNNMISVNARQQDAGMCQEILTLAEQGMLSRFDAISKTIGKHEVTTTNSSAYEAVNLSLDSTQKANIQYISNLDIALQETNEAYLEWKLEPEPEAEYTLIELIKNAIKLLIISGVIAGITLGVIVAISILMSGKLLNPEDIKNRFGLYVIGQLPTEYVKKSFVVISRWVSDFGGITIKQEDYNRLARMIGSSLKSDLHSSEESREWKKIAFTGTVKEEEIKKLLERLDIGASYKLICASDILTNAESIEKVANADCVVLVEKQEQTKIADIAKELEALQVWNKKVLGVIVLNTDVVV